MCRQSFRGKIPPMRKNVLLWLLTGCLLTLKAQEAEVPPLEQRLRQIMQEVNRRWRDHKQKPVRKVVVLPISLQPLIPPKRFRVPLSARSVIIKDGIYYRKRRPTFLLGVEGRMYDGAWMNRILGLDLFCQH